MLATSLWPQRSALQPEVAASFLARAFYNLATGGTRGGGGAETEQVTGCSELPTSRGRGSSINPGGRRSCLLGRCLLLRRCQCAWDLQARRHAPGPMVICALAQLATVR